MDKELIINGLKYVLAESDPIYEANGLQWTKTFEKMTWQEAVEFCQTLEYGEYSDWRLPTRKELLSLIDDTKVNPGSTLPDTKSSYYWSATTGAYNSGNAWLVYFDSGGVGNGYKSSSYYVRAVRGGGE